MDQVTVEAIGAVLIAAGVLLTLHIKTICPKSERNKEERRKLLKEELQSKIREIKDNNIDIIHFLPLFKEHEEIQSWKQQVDLIYVYFAFSFLLSLSGLFIGLMNFGSFIGTIQFETLLNIGGGLFLLVGLVVMIDLSRGIDDWRDKNTKGNPS